MKIEVLNLCRKTGIIGLKAIDIKPNTKSYKLPEAILLCPQYGASRPRR